MERSDVIARAAADLHGLADASDEWSNVASSAGRLKATEFVLQLCRQLKVIWTDARLLALTDGSVDLVITSPPYCNAPDYTRAHALATGWLSDVLSINPHKYSSLGCHNIGSDHVQVRLLSGWPTHAWQLPLVLRLIPR